MKKKREKRRERIKRKVTVGDRGIVGDQFEKILWPVVRYLIARTR